MPKMINLAWYVANLTGYRLMKWYSPLQIALGSGFVEGMKFCERIHRPKSTVCNIQITSPNNCQIIEPVLGENLCFASPRKARIKDDRTLCWITASLSSGNTLSFL